MAQDKTFTWIVAYIDINHVKNVQFDLNRSGEYLDVTAYIPTVKVLKKKLKGVENFDEVPLLFNYGFFRLPRYLAMSKNYLDNMKTNINCIFAWVSDPSKTIGKRPELHEGNIRYDDSHVPIATATSEEIAALVEAARDNTIFSAAEVDKIKVGDTITLRGYPWDGLDANVLAIDYKKQNIKVVVPLFNQLKEMDVSFDSVFFTIYKHPNQYDEESRGDKSLDLLQDKHVLDRLTFNLDRDGIK